MHRAVVEQCLPGLLALLVLSGLLWGLARCCGARLRWQRLREVHRCQAGGVQSLAFVITLPLFLMILLFIVQVSLLMHGLMTVNYAAFAAARSAAVWIPAQVGDPSDPTAEHQNQLPPGIVPNQPYLVDVGMAQGSPKFAKIFDAATLACVPMAPSRNLGSTDLGLLGATQTDDAAFSMFSTLSPAAAGNPRLRPRLDHKIAYCRQNTVLSISFIDKNSGVTPGSTDGPTYNPPDMNTHRHIDSEVGWQDPVTIEVQHRFALLPGPGRFLASLVVRPDGRADSIAPLIQYDNGVHKVLLRASATLTVEGIKSARPYVQTEW